MSRPPGPIRVERCEGVRRGGDTGAEDRAVTAAERLGGALAGQALEIIGRARRLRDAGAAEPAQTRQWGGGEATRYRCAQ